MNDDARFSAPSLARTLRVVIADDSAVQRAMLAALLDADPELIVIGRAADGAEAIQHAATLRPDVLAIDAHMPGLDGFEATRRIMQETPLPIVMVSNDAVGPLTSKALAAGALAIVPKPGHGPAGVREAAALVETIKRMAQVRVIRRWSADRFGTGQLGASPQRPVVRPVTGELTAPRPAAAPRRAPGLVAIGASTGGPQALQAILTQLPATFTPPVVIVQHIAQGFAESVIEWLAPQCALPFQMARAGTRLDRPGIYLAPTGRHLIVQGQTLNLSDAPPVRMHRPSATILFRSVAASYGARAIGVLLTGMGDDGAAGLADLRAAGATTIAQDEASSVVFGMPAAAIGMGVVDHVLPPAKIPALLQRLAVQADREMGRATRSVLPSRGS